MFWSCLIWTTALTNHISQLTLFPATPTGAPKIKLYTDEEGHLKGDGLCCYLKVGVAHIFRSVADHMITQVESVGLVIQLLHESKYRDKTLHVERVSVSLSVLTLNMCDVNIVYV